MKPTIERIILEDESYRPESVSYKEHTARYEFVSKFVKDKTVLDFACGVGYGSKILHDEG